MPDFLNDWNRAADDCGIAYDPEPVSRLAPEIRNLTGYCRLYRQSLLKHPDWLPWLVDPEVHGRPFGLGSMRSEWEALPPDAAAGRDFDALRRFRRRISLRIAFREINQIAPLVETLREQTELAEFCLQLVFAWSLENFQRRLGVPWDEDLDRPAELCVLGFGKLGGYELNFCSDVDLSFVYEGEGRCRKDGHDTQLPNPEFFTRVCQEANKRLTQRTADGFLYNVDLRLRPEGSSGRLVSSLNAMEQYYFTRGQTWERLALLRARPVAGNMSVGGEFLEIVHAFRYPRYPPEHLAEDVAGLKERTETELLGHLKIDRNIKSGTGGIREIEFFTQVLQLINAGHYPFLQTESTQEAINQLERYGLISSVDADALKAAYHLLRLTENRLQMVEEKQTHELPADPGRLAALAASLGFDDAPAFEAALNRHRQAVRRRYQELLPEGPSRENFREWYAFFSGNTPTEHVADRLRQWFGNEPGVADRIRKWVLGGAGSMVTREQVQFFLDIASQFDEAFARIANPLETVMRLDKFASAYGARKAFFRTCSLNPSLFQVLCLLFDRSRFIHNVLCRHPEIMEEILALQVNRKKDRNDMIEEIRLGPDGDSFPRWLWLYVKAEQVRIAINQLLDVYGIEDVERNLTRLADAAVTVALEKADSARQLAVIALGKFGGAEMSLGSDLDLIVLGSGQPLDAQIKAARDLIQILGFKHTLGQTFEIDLRLRPHGMGGPLVTTPDALREYHRSRAHPWEIQILTRARSIAGDPELIRAFRRIRNDVVWSRPLDASQLDAINDVRRRALEEKGNVHPPERAFKVVRGGIMDIEFLAQLAQIQCGVHSPALRSPNTRTVLQALPACRLADSSDVESLVENYNFLRRLEHFLRRDLNRPVTVIPADPFDREHLADWLGFDDYEAFSREHNRRLHHTRARCDAILEKLIPAAGP